MLMRSPRGAPREQIGRLHALRHQDQVPPPLAALNTQ